MEERKKKRGIFNIIVGVIFTALIFSLLPITSSLNGKQLVEKYSTGNPTSDNSAVYLLITNNALSGAFQPLVDRRTSQGKPGKLVTIEDINEIYDGNRPDGGTDLQTKIRNCIIDHYVNHGTQWVLLGGDDTIIPIRYVLGTNKDNARPGELYYSDMNGGSWDLDADGIYGEATDVTPTELYPEVNLGRIPVQNAQQASDYVRKVAIFEDTPADDFPYGTLFVTGGDSSSCVGIIDYRRPIGNVELGYTSWYWQKIQPYWQSVPMHEFYSPYTSWDQVNWGDYDANSQHLVDRLSQGEYQFVLYSGHGNVPWWFLENSIWGTGDAFQLTNPVPFILRSGGCWTGAFDWYDPSIAEAFLRDPNGGAVLVTVYAGTPAGNHQDIMYEEMFANNIYNLGEAFTHAKQLTASTYDVYAQTIYVFLGDPAIDRRTDQLGRNLQLYMPDAMEFYDVGDDITIRWNASGNRFTPGEAVRLDYSSDSGATWNVVPGAEELPFNAMAFTWHNHGLAKGDHYRIRVVSLADSGALSSSRLDFRVVEVGLLTVQSTPLKGVLIGGSQPQTTDYTYAVPIGDTITLVAPTVSDKLDVRWADVNGNTLSTDPNYSFVLAGDTTLIAEYEYLGPSTHYYVNDEIAENGIQPGDDRNDGLSPQTPVRHINRILELDPNIGWGNVIHVSAGTYIENISLNANNSGLNMLGAGANVTIIDGNQINSCVRVDGTIFFSISEFTFRNGKTYLGGGIGVFNQAQVNITNNRFINNNADSNRTGWGGGIYAENSNSEVTIQNNIFSCNQALYAGDGVCLYNIGNALVANNTFINNIGSQYGGGISMWYSQVTIIGNMFLCNKANRGGGIYAANSNVTISNNVIQGNYSSSNGGGICLYNGVTALIVNNTITGNRSKLFGGGISCWESNCIINNSILWDNNSLIGQEIALLYTSSVYQIKTYYNDIKGGKTAVYMGNGYTLDWGPGNINIDPCFVFPGFWDTNGTPTNTNDDFWVDGDYHLKSEAGRWDPNAGKSADLTGDVFVDFNDFAVFAESWDQSGTQLPADLDEDGIVSMDDLVIFAEKFLTDGRRGGWVIDEVTSRCIDAGNPGNELGDEPKSVDNLRIDMGSYGGTAEASMPPPNWSLLADVTNDGIVDFNDFAYQAKDWQFIEPYLPGDFNRDGVVDTEDIALLTVDWLKESSWHD